MPFSGWESGHMRLEHSASGCCRTRQDGSSRSLVRVPLTDAAVARWTGTLDALASRACRRRRGIDAASAGRRSGQGEPPLGRRFLRDTRASKCGGMSQRHWGARARAKDRTARGCQPRAVGIGLVPSDGPRTSDRATRADRSHSAAPARNGAPYCRDLGHCGHGSRVHPDRG